MAPPQTDKYHKWKVSDMWFIEWCHRQLIHLQGHFNDFRLNNKRSLLLLSLIESPDGLMKDGIADDLV